MALDTDLLDKFERDWGEALENYEARTRAARMGNVVYDPASRIFEAQEPPREVTSGIQGEIFGPLQAKWGLLAEGSRGAARPGSVDIQNPWSSPMPVGGGGIVQVNKQTGEVRTNREPSPTASRTGTTRAPSVSVGDRATLNQTLRRICRSALSPHR